MTKEPIKTKKQPKSIIVTDMNSKRTRVIVFDSYKSLKQEENHNENVVCPASLFYNYLILLF